MAVINKRCRRPQNKKKNLIFILLLMTERIWTPLWYIICHQWLDIVLTGIPTHAHSHTDLPESASQNCLPISVLNMPDMYLRRNSTQKYVGLIRKSRKSEFFGESSWSCYCNILSYWYSALRQSNKLFMSEWKQGTSCLSCYVFFRFVLCRYSASTDYTSLNKSVYNKVP